jgi:lysozyme
MSFRAIVRKMLVRHEGVRTYPYQDSLGIWTIGIGHNLQAKPIPGWSLEGLKQHGLPHQEMNAVFDRDVDDAEADARAVCPVFDKLDDTRKAILVDMAFNLGRTRLGQFKQFLAAVSAGDYKTAAKEMLDSYWARQVKLRAKNLAATMETGQFS